MRKLLTIKEAAALLGLGTWGVRRLIQDADENKGSTWRFGRELVDLTPSGNKHRIIRINPAAIAPSVAALANPPDSSQ